MIVFIKFLFRWHTFNVQTSVPKDWNKITLKSKKYNLNLDTEKISKIFFVFLVIYACFANFKIVHMYI
jgi:hypothetical protein